MESKKPRPIADPGIDLSSYQKIEGTLETYFETGMECLGLILYDNTKLISNPNFDASKPEEGMNFPHFKDWSGIHFISNGNFLQVGDGPIWGMLKDREFGQQDGYSISFYPCGFSKKEWTSLFVSEKVTATLWKKVSK